MTRPGRDTPLRDAVRQIGYSAGNQEIAPSICPLPPTAMPLGIRPVNDFAFKKTFGTAENRVALGSWNGVGPYCYDSVFSSFGSQVVFGLILPANRLSSSRCTPR